MTWKVTVTPGPGKFVQCEKYAKYAKCAKCGLSHAPGEVFVITGYTEDGKVPVGELTCEGRKCA